MEKYHDLHLKSMMISIIIDTSQTYGNHQRQNHKSMAAPVIKCSFVDGSHYVTLWHPDDFCTSIVQYKNGEFAKSVVVKTSTFLVPGIMTILKDVRI